MRVIRLAKVDKVRPVVILTRPQVLPYLKRVTVAPITSTIRGLSSEVPVGPKNGLDRQSVISCDNILTITAEQLLQPIGYLLDEQEPQLTEAINRAFDLAPHPSGG